MTLSNAPTEEQIKEQFKKHDNTKALAKTLNLKLNTLYPLLRKLNLKYIESPKVSKEDLSKYYPEESSRELGKRFGVSYQTILNWLEHYGIAIISKKNKKKVSDAKLIELFDQGLTLKEMALASGVCQMTISKRLQKLNLFCSERDYGQKRKGCPKKVSDAKLIELFDQGLTLKEMALASGVSQTAIANRLKKLNLFCSERDGGQKRKGARSKVSDAKLIELLDQGLTSKNIALASGVSQSAIINRLKRMKISK